MGVHAAYHRSFANRLLHWLAIPCELASVVTLLSFVHVGPIDLALIGLVLVAPIYLATEPLIGALMVGFLAGCRAGALHLSPSLATVLGAASVFAVTFGVQVRIGHGVFEEGRDDTNQNLAEVRRTKNPIPILLVFYYHLVEIVLLMGYRPQLKRAIAELTEKELADWADQPPARLD